MLLEPDTFQLPAYKPRGCLVDKAKHWVDWCSQQSVLVWGVLLWQPQLGCVVVQVAARQGAHNCAG